MPRSARKKTLGANGALERGLDLPKPLGASLFLVYMSRDIEVYDVRVTLPGDEPVSIIDVASFDVRNHTALAAVKLDAWILPLLNVYVMAGHTWTDTRLDATITLERRLGAIVVEVYQRPVNPVTVQAGGSAMIGKRWELLLEAGSNFDDAFVGVGSAAYRF